MQTCRVVGKAQATVKHPSLEGARLLVVRALDGGGKAAGTPFLSVDAVGAGPGEVVAVTMGCPASRALGSRSPGSGDAPLDAVIVAILDNVVVDGKIVYTREEEKV